MTERQKQLKKPSVRGCTQKLFSQHGMDMCRPGVDGQYLDLISTCVEKKTCTESRGMSAVLLCRKMRDVKAGRDAKRACVVKRFQGSTDFRQTSASVNVNNPNSSTGQPASVGPDFTQLQA